MISNDDMAICFSFVFKQEKICRKKYFVPFA